MPPLELLTQPVAPKDDHKAFVATLLHAWRSECLHGGAISPAELQRLHETLTEVFRVALQSLPPILYAWRSECTHGDAISSAELQRLQHTVTELLLVALQSEGITLQELRVFAGALLRRTL